MNHRAMLESELSMVEEMLEEIPPGRVIERAGLERRLEQLRSELAALPESGARISLTFRGEPVTGSESIQAEFGGKAAALFSEAVATVSASLATDLGSAGPLPQGAERHLRIVGTATGSFGFELELPPPAQGELPGLGSEMPDAVVTTLDMIREAGAGNEDALSELIATTHPRVASKLSEFVRLVVDRNAGFNLSFGDHRTAVLDAAEGRSVLESLNYDQIRQQDVSMNAVIIGILPEARRFEARTDEGLVLRGRIDRAAGDPTQLQKQWLNRRARLDLRETQVRSGRPSYVLVSVVTRSDPPSE